MHAKTSTGIFLTPHTIKLREITHSTQVIRAEEVTFTVGDFFTLPLDKLKESLSVLKITPPTYLGVSSDFIHLSSILLKNSLTKKQLTLLCKNYIDKKSNHCTFTMTTQAGEKWITFLQIKKHLLTKLLNLFHRRALMPRIIVPQPFITLKQLSVDRSLSLLLIDEQDRILACACLKTKILSCHYLKCQTNYSTTKDNILELLELFPPINIYWITHKLQKSIIPGLLRTLFPTSLINTAGDELDLLSNWSTYERI